MNIISLPSAKEQEARRRRAIEAIQQGFSQSHVAAMLGITSASVSNWALRFRSGGFEELLAKRPGRPPGGQLSPKQAAEVQHVLRTRCPDEAGLQARLWTWRAVQALICRCGDVEVSRWTALRYLNSWGFRPPNPASRLATAEQDLADRYQAIRLQARRGGSVFYCIEHSALAANDDAAAPGSAPGVLWALGARAEAAFMVVAEHSLQRRMTEFLERVMDHSGGRPCVVVVDDALRLDRSVLAWADDQTNKIVVKTLASNLRASEPSDVAAVVPLNPKADRR